jgi:hypothetical protein
MNLVFSQGVVLVKVYRKTTAGLYTVKRKLFYKGGLKWGYREVIVDKSFITSNRYISPENFNQENKYYDAEEKKVFWNPHCDLYLANQSVQAKFFETEEKLDEFILSIRANFEIIEV